MVEPTVVLQRRGSDIDLETTFALEGPSSLLKHPKKQKQMPSRRSPPSGAIDTSSSDYRRFTNDEVAKVPNSFDPALTEDVFTYNSGANIDSSRRYDDFDNLRSSYQNAAFYADFGHEQQARNGRDRSSSRSAKNHREEFTDLHEQLKNEIRTFKFTDRNAGRSYNGVSTHQHLNGSSPPHPTPPAPLVTNNNPTAAAALVHGQAHTRSVSTLPLRAMTNGATGFESTPNNQSSLFSYQDVNHNRTLTLERSSRLLNGHSSPLPPSVVVGSERPAQASSTVSTSSSRSSSCSSSLTCSSDEADISTSRKNHTGHCHRHRRHCGCHHRHHHHRHRYGSRHHQQHQRDDSAADYKVPSHHRHNHSSGHNSHRNHSSHRSRDPSRQVRFHEDSTTNSPVLSDDILSSAAAQHSGGCQTCERRRRQRIQKHQLSLKSGGVSVTHSATQYEKDPVPVTSLPIKTAPDSPRLSSRRQNGESHHRPSPSGYGYAEIAQLDSVIADHDEDDSVQSFGLEQKNHNSTSVKRAVPPNPHEPPGISLEPVIVHMPNGDIPHNQDDSFDTGSKTPQTVTDSVTISNSQAADILDPATRPMKRPKRKKRKRKPFDLSKAKDVERQVTASVNKERRKNIIKVIILLTILLIIVGTVVGITYYFAQKEPEQEGVLPDQIAG